jgi:hypothetical protein
VQSVILVNTGCIKPLTVDRVTHLCIIAAAAKLKLYTVIDVQRGMMETCITARLIVCSTACPYVQAIELGYIKVRTCNDLSPPSACSVALNDSTYDAGSGASCWPACAAAVNDIISLLCCLYSNQHGRISSCHVADDYARTAS